MSNTVYVGTKGSGRRASLAPIVQGSTESVHTITAQYADGSTYDLTGKSLSGTWYRSGAPGTVYDITGTLTVTDAASGIFTWDKSAADASVPGVHIVQFVVTAGDGEIDGAFTASMVVEARAEATNVIAGDTIDGGDANSTPITEIDGGDANGE